VTTDAPAAPSDAPPAPEWIDVFISYSRRDGDFVRRLHDALTARGKDVWADWEDIPATAAWRERIADGIDSANAVVFVLSPDSVESVECNAELDLAAAANKRIVPVVRRAVDPAGVRVELASLNWLFFREDDDFDEAFARLVDALETDLAWLDAHTRLLKRAREWDAGGRDKSFLLRGRDLDAAESWLRVQSDHKESATPLQVDYIVASRQSSTRRQRITLGAVGTALAVSIGLTALALVMRSQAISREHTARSRELSVSAVAQLVSDPELGLILAREAVRAAPTAEAQVALRRLLGASSLRDSVRLDTPVTGRTVRFTSDGSRAVMTGSRGRALGWTAPSSITPLSGLKPFTDPELSADGRLAVFVRRDGSAPIVRTRDWRQVGLLHGPLTYASLIGDGRTALTVRRGAIELRRVPGGQVAARFGDDKVMGVSASRDGRVVVEESNLNPGGDVPLSEALLWRAPWRRPVRLEGESGASFSLDGRVLVTCGLVVRDGRTGRLVHRLRPRGPCTGAASLSPTGAVAVTGDVVWETRAGRRIAVLTAAGEESSPVAFSRDGTMLVTAGDPGVAFVWDLATGVRLAELRGGGTVVGAFFSPDNRRVTTLSDDGVLRRWDVPLARGTISVHGTPMGVVASGGRLEGAADTTAVESTTESTPAMRWSARRVRGRLRVRERAMPRYEVVDPAAGRYAVVTKKGLDKFVLIDTRTGRFVRNIAGNGDGLLFSPNGRFLMLPSGGGVEVREVSSWRRVGSLSHFDFVIAAENAGAALSDDGSRVFAANPGGTGIWDVSSGERLAKLPGLQTYGLIGGSNATFSHDGRWLAVMSDGRTRILDGRTGELVAELRGQSSPSWVEFSADDALVATAGDDGTVRVWDPATGTPLSTVKTHDDLLGVTFDQRTPAIATWTLDGTMRVYDCDVCGDLSALERRADARIARELTSAERRRYGL